MYVVKFVVGNQDMPGARLLHVTAMVDAPTGRISGTAEITQAIAGPDGQITISNVSGYLRSLGFGESSRIATLSGTYSPSPIEPMILTFAATLVLEQDTWAGTGSFSYGGHHVADVPVTLVEQSGDAAATSALAGSAT